jgi:hypothetical protein
VRARRQINQAVLVVPRGTYRLPQTRLLDLRLSRSFNVRPGRVEAVADLFNALNSSATTSEVEQVGLGIQWRF